VRAVRTKQPFNRLIEALPRREKRRMHAACEQTELAFADVLHETAQRIQRVYFPTNSFISLIMPVDVTASLEVGLVGDEGMLGTSLLLGVDVAPVRAVVQGAGPALQMDADVFRDELERSAALRQELNRYLFVQLAQLAQTAACTRYHLVEARLARWLLMTQDRAHTDVFHLTQEFLAFMLGVRRVGITKAARALQGRGLIRYSRGSMTVLDRRGLKRASCTCYEADRTIYERILG
jgi:Crp-like helix-turn-helix domain